ncbi:MAG: RNA-binding protein [Eubacteriales bacterium]|jgi:RNA-binding protein YlmH|nr:RNA-binding protein [Clostridiales bacterium]
MDETRLLINRAADKYRACASDYILTNTPFLDLAQQSVLDGWIRREKIAGAFFFGGYSDAERMVLCFCPDYIADPAAYFAEYEDCCPVAALRAAVLSPDTLSHRDYLGALMGLGLKREIIGDILVGDGYADIILLRDALPLVLRDFTKAGRAPLKCRELPLSELAPPPREVRKLRDTVASPRLDAAVGVAFSLSRGKAAEAIERGLVYVNNRLCEKPDATVSEGDRLTLRGMGRAVILELGGTSRSGRIFITVER